MRIRKNASKILGTATSPASQLPSSPPPPPPPPPAPTSTNAPPASGLLLPLVCVVNRSPWDVFPSPGSPPSSPHHDGKPISNSKVVEGEGILGNKITKQEPMSPSKSTILWEELHCKKSMAVIKKGKRTKRVSKKSVNKDVVSVTTCKKSVGNRWHCKREAALPSSLCTYHLAQRHSSSKRVGADSAAADGGRKMAGTARATVGSGSNYYYYYSSFGPWRGKRRGVADTGDGGSNAAVIDDDKKHTGADDDAGFGCGGDDMEEDSAVGKSSNDKVKKGGGGGSGTITRKRGRRKLSSVDDDAGFGCGGVDMEENSAVEKSSNNKVKKGVGTVTRKRGRRVVKERSLKSLF